MPEPQTPKFKDSYVHPHRMQHITNTPFPLQPLLGMSASDMGAWKTSYLQVHTTCLRIRGPLQVKERKGTSDKILKNQSHQFPLAGKPVWQTGVPWTGEGLQGSQGH